MNNFLSRFNLSPNQISQVPGILQSAPRFMPGGNYNSPSFAPPQGQPTDRAPQKPPIPGKPGSTDKRPDRGRPIPTDRPKPTVKPPQKPNKPKPPGKPSVPNGPGAAEALGARRSGNDAY